VYGGRNDKNKGLKLLPDAFQLVGISRCNRIPNSGKLFRQSREGKGREGKGRRSHNLI
jgi:hypothetical protein